MIWVSRSENEVKALLDVHSVSISGGTISLHDDRGVPLKALDWGSARLLIAGLQRQVSRELIDGDCR